MADNETNTEDAPAEKSDATLLQMPADIIADIKALIDSVSLIDSKVDAMTTAITAVAEAGLAADADEDEDEDEEEEEEERDISDVEALDLTTPPDEA